MSRTIRKSKNGIKYNDGNLKHEGIRYSCNCSWCTGVDKRKLEKKIAMRELNNYLKAS